MDPEHVVLRWGNFDKTVMLPSTVFEPDESGRSYRFRPGVRSIWVRNFPMKGDVKAYFQVPDDPEAAELVKGTGAAIVEGSTQTTNSWGLRGPEPDTQAAWRGIVLGDSYMQGLFVGDDQTPTECLKRDLRKRLGGTVEILNTGHLGYSPEQYYYTLVEYAEAVPAAVRRGQRLRQRLRGRHQGRAGGPRRRLGRGEILARPHPRFLLLARHPCLFVPAPWVNQLDQPQLAGNYPGPISNILGATGIQYLDPINEFADALLSIEIDGLRRGEPVKGDPLFNGRIGDGHFSPQGASSGPSASVGRVSLLLTRAACRRSERRAEHDRRRSAAGRGPSRRVTPR